MTQTHSSWSLVPIALAASFVALASSSALADGPGDNLPDSVRRVPPPGIWVAGADVMEFQEGLKRLEDLLRGVPAALKGKPALLELVPDVEIFHKAVRDALRFNEIYKPGEIAAARALLAEGRKRAEALLAGDDYWTRATGLVVRGYRSKIDNSVQPYGLVIPKTYQPGSGRRHRLDLWFHGRGEQLSELSFIDGRMKQPGQFTPFDTIVLHPYGRYCCANRFAGEVDTFEALAHARRYYPIDSERIRVRGFSMGGAACWQFAVHHAGMWAAAAPGAGFSETAEFLKVFQNEKLKPTWWEQKLWHLYDATDYAINLYQCPTVAYSGEIDKQKQASDMMAQALAKEGIDMVHIIGPQTAHAYHPGAREEINRRLDIIVARGRNPIPHTIHFTTWTLRYNEMLWVRVNGLGKHWDRTRVDAQIDLPNNLRMKTENVTSLTLDMGPGLCPLDMLRRPRVTLDDQELEGAPVGSDRSWVCHFAREGGMWKRVPEPPGGLRKRNGLQGPIDDAFMDSFVMVRPTGTPLTAETGAWVKQEMAHAIEHWRRQFRGEAPVRDDSQIGDGDIANRNLVLWGDPSSNRVLARIADKLPMRWQGGKIVAGTDQFAQATHMPILIYPNPLNPRRYVVLNSGFTFREYDYLSNARQTPKLPDYAVVDISVPPSSRWPGKIVSAGFFDESWQLSKQNQQ